MYSIGAYGEMIADRTRMDAYVQALRGAVRPGAVVLDIGTGTGVFALLACQLGARKVFAIEPSDAIQLAREMAAANGCADRIEFHQAMSTEVEVSERADVVISDLRGVLPLFEDHIPTLIDARRRLLAPGGTLIPARDTLRVSAMEADATQNSLRRAWAENEFGLDMKAALRVLSNQWRRCRPDPENLLSEPATLGSIDYSQVIDTSFSGQVTLIANRAGVAAGLCVWFDATIAEGVGFSNAPGSPGAIYGNAFFPLSEPVPLEEGDQLEVLVRASLIDHAYHWNWRTRVSTSDTTACVKADFSQSSFFGDLLSSSNLRRRAAGHVPTLGPEGRIDATILTFMQDGMALGEIAHALMKGNPGRFSRWEDALGRVGELSVKYCS